MPTEFFAQGRNLLKVDLKRFFAAGHAAVVPHQAAKFTHEFENSLLAIDIQELVYISGDIFFAFFEFRMIGCNLTRLNTGQIAAYCVRNYKITVGQTLHEG
jgi:hypothetical protein